MPKPRRASPGGRAGGPAQTGPRRHRAGAAPLTGGALRPPTPGLPPACPVAGADDRDTAAAAAKGLTGAGGGDGGGGPAPRASPAPARSTRAPVLRCRYWLGGVHVTRGEHARAPPLNRLPPFPAATRPERRPVVS